MVYSLLNYQSWRKSRHCKRRAYLGSQTALYQLLAGRCDLLKIDEKYGFYRTETSNKLFTEEVCEITEKTSRKYASAWDGCYSIVTTV
jgi:hypothetical protein